MLKIAVVMATEAKINKLHAFLFFFRQKVKHAKFLETLFFFFFFFFFSISRP